MEASYPDLATFLEQTDTTQAEFAARVGVQQSLISRLVNGTRRPSFALALRIAAEARIPIESLMPSEQGESGAAA